jgi:hypothetical protein
VLDSIVRARRYFRSLPGAMLGAALERKAVPNRSSRGPESLARPVRHAGRGG